MGCFRILRRRLIHLPPIPYSFRLTYVYDWLAGGKHELKNFTTKSLRPFIYLLGMCDYSFYGYRESSMADKLIYPQFLKYLKLQAHPIRILSLLYWECIFLSFQCYKSYITFKFINAIYKTRITFLDNSKIMCVKCV